MVRGNGEGGGPEGGGGACLELDVSVDDGESMHGSQGCQDGDSHFLADSAL